MTQDLQAAWNAIGVALGLTTGTPQRAKVGDRVLSSYTGKEYTVAGADIHGVWGETWHLFHGNYTIVPQPERETFTGDPSKWGKGVYREVTGQGQYLSSVIVAEDGGYMWCSMDKRYLYTNKSSWTTTFTYHRISDDPSSFINPALLEGGV